MSLVAVTDTAPPLVVARTFFSVIASASLMVILPTWLVAFRVFTAVERLMSFVAKTLIVFAETVPPVIEPPAVKFIDPFVATTFPSASAPPSLMVMSCTLEVIPFTVNPFKSAKLMLFLATPCTVATSLFAFVSDTAPFVALMVNTIPVTVPLPIISPFVAVSVMFVPANTSAFSITFVPVRATLPPAFNVPPTDSAPVSVTVTFSTVEVSPFTARPFKSLRVILSLAIPPTVATSLFAFASVTAPLTALTVKFIPVSTLAPAVCVMLPVFAVKFTSPPARRFALTVTLEPARLTFPPAVILFLTETKPE